MEINVRNLGKYRDVELVYGDTTIALGLLDADECMALARQLRGTISDLLTNNQLFELENEDQ